MVTRKTIEQVIADGARSVQEVGKRSGAGTDCGKCQRTIQRLLQIDLQPPPHETGRLKPNLT